MKIKICGMRDAGNIREITALKLDYMGLIFYERSPRYCGGLNPAVVREIVEAGVKPVMVTVDKSEDEILRLADSYGIQRIQLHGNELPELCFSLREHGLKVRKAFGVRSAATLEMLDEYEGAVDGFLLDTLSVSKGGSGRKFDWSVLDAYDSEADFFLSGGIGPEDSAVLKSLVHPRFAGIDLNSRFEIRPGYKDAHLLGEFFRELGR